MVGFRAARRLLAATPALERAFARFSLLAGLFTVVLMLGASAGNVFEDAELATVDTRFDLRGTTEHPAELLVVEIDAETFGELKEQWPFPRRLHAELINEIAADKPAAIVYDVQFTEQSELEDDNQLIKAVAAARNVVLATTEVADDGSTNVFGGIPLAELGARAGSALFAPSPGGVIRELPRVVEGLPTLAVVAAEVATGWPVAGDLDRDDWIDFHGAPGSIETISFADALDQPEGYYADRIVVIGASAPSLKDIHTTSTSSGEFMSGPELEAHAISTVLRDFPLQSSPVPINLALIIVLGLVPGLLARRLPLGPLVGVVAALVIAYLVTVQLAFNAGLVLPVLYPLVALALATVGVVVVAAALFSLARERARDTFARFVPRAVVDDVLARTDDDLRLGGTTLDGTALFVDLRSFTPFVEEHDAEEVIAVLNRYLETVSNAVHARGGTVVAYQGDGVMAVFGAPLPQDDHAERAVACARELVTDGLPAFNVWARDRGLGGEFAIGIGVASGTLRSGNVGSADRVEYTAIGDATNTAARLQAQTRETGDTTLVAASVLERLDNSSGLVDAGKHAVSGKLEPVQTYTLA